MKKFAFLFTLLLVLSIAGSADDGGEYPSGGRSCPQGQVCRPAAEPADKPILDNIFDFLKSIFR